MAGCRCGLIGVLLATIAGCFSERTIPMRPGDFVPVDFAAMERSEPGDTRAWLRAAHASLSGLLPPGDPEALPTNKLRDANGRARDVFAHFGIKRDGLQSVFTNFSGLLHSAQAAGTSSDRPVAMWDGFEDVWIPINDRLELSGKLGFAHSGDKIGRADCVVLISGVFGNNNISRTYEIALALRSGGLHVLALELRGAGRTAQRFPKTPYNFGAVEVGDLLAVSDWLESRPEVRRTGLIGYCWGANLALLTAWEDGREQDDADVAANLRPHLHPRDGVRHFSAGIMAFSPTLRFEEVIAQLDQRRWSVWNDPVLETLQKEVDEQAARQGFGDLHGSLRRLIEQEFIHTSWNYPNAFRDGLRYLRLMPFDDKPVGAKLEAARMPVLVIHAANDPLGAAQAVADFVAPLENRHVAALVLAGGGHVGFIPYARAYAYSIILDFFDPQYGAAAYTRQAARHAAKFTAPSSGSTR